MKAPARLTADARRAQVLAIAVEEFARGGIDTSADTIARRAGISQPYLFRLFGSKQQLVLLAIARSFERIRESFDEAAAGLAGRDALIAMGRRYDDLLRDRTFLLVQLRSFAACEDREVRDVVRREFAHLWRTVEEAARVPAEDVRQFMATGMLLNVAAAMNLSELDEPWAHAIVHPPPSGT